ncbi:MAG: AMP-binding protein, partial [Cyanobium sp. ELA507]
MSLSPGQRGSGLYGALCQVAARHADAVALSGSGGRSWTYAQLLAGLERIAANLRGSGVQPGDRVVVVAPSGPEGALAVLAAACCCSAAPLPAGLAVPALAERIRRLAPRLLIVPDGRDAAAAAATAAAACGVPIVMAPASASPSPQEIPSLQDSGAWGLAADTALALTTSGTTAEPRLVPLSHANLLAAADSIRAVLQLAPEDRCLDPMPLAHIHGLSLVIASLLSGSRLHLPDTFAQESFLGAWQQLQPTWYSAAPAMHALIADWLEQRPDLLSRSSLRFVRSASGPMPRALLERLEHLLDVPPIEAYGMTEAAPQISSNRLPPHPRKPGSVGQAAGPEIAILDGEGQPLPPGVTGEVAIRGANVMAGYLEDPEA